MDAGYKIMFKHAGMECMMYVKQNSSYLRDLKIIEKGSGNIRNKQAIWPDNIDARPSTVPIRNRKMKLRRGESREKKEYLQSAKLDIDATLDPIIEEEKR